MPLDESGVGEFVSEVFTDDIPATSDLNKVYDITKGKDYNVNYIIIDFLTQGVTDTPTLVEMLVKMGTMNIVTQGSGKWGTDLDFDDLYYRCIARNFEGKNQFIIGGGGGGDDFLGFRIILDAGGNLTINNELGWTPNLEAELKIKYGADAGLDNSTIRITKVGYRDGTPPKAVLAIDNAEITPNAKGDLHKFNVNSGELLQEYFAFLTTELNLATIQDITTFGIQELQLRPHDEESKLRILSYVNQMVDGINDDGADLIQQYVRKMFDPKFQGYGIALNKDDVIAIKAGVAEATRHYISRLQPIAVI